LSKEELRGKEALRSMGRGLSPQSRLPWSLTAEVAGDHGASSTLVATRYVEWATHPHRLLSPSANTVVNGTLVNQTPTKPRHNPRWALRPRNAKKNEGWGDKLKIGKMVDGRTCQPRYIDPLKSPTRLSVRSRLRAGAGGIAQ
jgi:hypothetical protein